MTIRKATIKDFAAVERMLHSFHEARQIEVPADLYDSAHFRQTYRALIGSPDAVCAVLELDGEVKGCLLAGVTTSPFAPVKVAEEVVWWVDEDARGKHGVKLLDLYERWATDAGARVIGLYSFEEEAPALYAKRDYRPVERKFAKVV